MRSELFFFSLDSVFSRLRKFKSSNGFSVEFSRRQFKETKKNRCKRIWRIFHSKDFYIVGYLSKEELSVETLRGAQSSIDQLAQCLSTRSWKVLYREIKVHASNSPPLYIRLRGFICVPVRERSETSSLVRSLRRRHIGDGMERHASFRDWRFSQGVKRLTSVEGGRKRWGKVENAGGDASDGRERAGKRERRG